jgi:hypothetical protein
MTTATPAPRGEARTSLPLACSLDDRQLILSLLRDYLDRSAAGRLRPLLAGEFHDLTDLWSQDGYPV